MKNSFFYFLISIFISILFLISVFVNNNIKSIKDELIVLTRQIENLKVDIKRLEIEVSVYESPVNVIEFIEKNGYKPLNFTSIKTIYLKND